MRLNKLNEAIRKANETYYTYSTLDLIEFMKNTMEDWRILYDAREGLYLFAKAFDTVHWRMIKDAYNEGLYDKQFELINSLGTIQNYFDNGRDGYFENENNENEKWVDPWLYSIIFVPIEDNKFNYVYDGYDQSWRLPDNMGYYLSDQIDFEETPIYKKLGSLEWEGLH